jgi:hypothetical protein
MSLGLLFHGREPLVIQTGQTSEVSKMLCSMVLMSIELISAFEMLDGRLAKSCKRIMKGSHGTVIIAQVGLRSSTAGICEYDER